MKIEGSDYILEQSKTYDSFDLYLLQHVVSKNTRDEFKLEGYNMQLSAAIHKIINFRLSKIDKTLTLKQYVDEYKSILNTLKLEIKND